MNFVCQQNLKVSVPGKAILIGEHSVVYGHPAIAFPLLNVQLHISMQQPTQIHEISSWHEAWCIEMKNEVLCLSEQMKVLLTSALKETFCLFNQKLDDFSPQKIFIQTEIPLGGGMGGSAAISSSLVRICAKLFDKNLSYEEEVLFSNKIDSLFHFGKASGLDVSTVLGKHFIFFNKGHAPKILNVCLGLWVALVDSEERSETAVMVKKVSAQVEAKNTDTLHAIEHLGTLTHQCVDELFNSNSYAVATILNEAQELLCLLGVSTDKINTLCHDLKKEGALCAKLTGAGGGGLVLSLFREKPDHLLKRYGYDKVFLTQI